MSLLGRMTGRRLSEGGVRAQARALLEECRQLGNKNSGAAVALLRRRVRPVQQALGYDGPLHHELVCLYFELRQRLGVVRTGLPTQTLVSWEELGCLGDLVERAHRNGGDLLWLRSSRLALRGDAMAEVEARCAFAEAPQLVLALIGDAPPLLVRTRFVVDSVELLGRDLTRQELPRALSEAARRLFLEARVF